MNANDKNLLIGYILIGVVLLFLLWRLSKLYRLKYDNIIEFVGGEGSGKTLSAVQLALKLYSKNLSKWNRKRIFINCAFWFNKDEKKSKIGAKPALYSNIPVSIYRKKGKNYFSRVLISDILTLRKGVEPGSVLLIDELGQVLDQYVNYKNSLIRYDCREFFRLFRHYTQGGYMVCTDQVAGDNAKPIRDRINVFYWCFDFKKVLSYGNHLLYKYRIKSFMRMENTQTMTTGSFVEDGSKWKWGFLNRKLYDTYCYSERYRKLDATFENVRWSHFKTNRIIEVIPHISPLDDADDAEEKKRAIKALEKKYGKSVIGCGSGNKKEDDADG